MQCPLQTACIKALYVEVSSLEWVCWKCSLLQWTIWAGKGVEMGHALPVHSKIKRSLNEAFFLKTGNFSKCCIFWLENIKFYLLSKSLVKFCSSHLPKTASFNLAVILPETRPPQKSLRLSNTVLWSPTNIIKTKGVCVSHLSKSSRADLVAEVWKWSWNKLLVWSLLHHYFFLKGVLYYTLEGVLCYT